MSVSTDSREDAASFLATAAIFTGAGVFLGYHFPHEWMFLASFAPVSHGDAVTMSAVGLVLLGYLVLWAEESGTPEQ